MPHERDPKAVAQSLDHIAKAIQEPAAGLDTVSGTALLGLADISPHLPPETIAATWASLGPYLHGVISGDSNAQLSTRVSAIQAVSLTGQRQYLEPIRSFAASEADIQKALGRISSALSSLV